MGLQLYLLRKPLVRRDKGDLLILQLLCLCLCVRINRSGVNLTQYLSVCWTRDPRKQKRPNRNVRTTWHVLLFISRMPVAACAPSFSCLAAAHNRIDGVAVRLTTSRFGNHTEVIHTRLKVLLIMHTRLYNGSQVWRIFHFTRRVIDLLIVGYLAHLLLILLVILIMQKS